MSYTYEIADLLTEFEIVDEGTYRGGEAYRYVDTGWHAWEDHAGTPFEVPGLGTVTLIESGEDQRDHRHLVFKVTHEGGSERFYRLDGYYSSYNGTEWDGDLYEVKPQQKTFTVYER